MATVTAKAKAKTTSPANGAECINLDSWSVDRVRVSGTGMVSFTLTLNGVAINGCRVRESKDGREFIAMPQYKGSDDRYYNHVYVRLSEEDQAEILAEVANQM